MAKPRDLVKLGGVGRKTANVIRSVAFGLPGLLVDTHVGRLVRRLGLTEEKDPVKVELALNPIVPEYERGPFSLRFIRRAALLPKVFLGLLESATRSSQRTFDLEQIDRDSLVHGAHEFLA